MTATVDRSAAQAAPAQQRPALGPIALLGVGGSVLLAVATWRVGAIGRTPWWGGEPPLPRWAAYVMWVIGLAALSGAWLLLRRTTVRAGTSVSGRAVVAIAALWMVPLLLAPPIGSRDVYSYVAHGELAAQGLDPGIVPPRVLGLGPVLEGVDPIWRNVVSAYGPGSTLVSEVAVDASDHHVRRATIVLRVWSIAGVALLGLGVAALASAMGRNRADALVLAIAGPLTIVQLVGGAHNEALMVGLMACGLAVAVRRPDTWGLVVGAALCGLGASIKLPALLGAVYIGWVFGGPAVALGLRLARAALATMVAVATIAVVGVVAGVGWGWVDGLRAGANVTTLLSISTTLGLLAKRMLGQRGGLTWAVSVVRSLFLMAGVAVAGVLLWSAPTLGLAALAGAFAVLAVLGPAVHPWYFTWGLPAAAVTFAGRAVWWPLWLAVGVAAATRPGGGGLVRNLGLFPIPLALTLIGIGLVVAVALSRESDRRTSPAPSAARTPAAS